MHSHHMHREHQVSHRRVHHILKDHPPGATHHAKHGGAFSRVTSKTAAEHHDHKIHGHKGKHRFARGGHVHSDEAEDRAMMKKMMAEHMHAHHKGKFARGGAAYRGSGPFPGQSEQDAQEGRYSQSERKSRMLQGYARGGKVHKKGGNTTNIIVAHGGKPPLPAGPMAGPLADGPPPMPPPGAGPGLPPGLPPGGPPMPMRARGGKILDGEASEGNIRNWSKRAHEHSYARGGKITAGAESGVGRLQKASRHRGK